MQPAKELLRRDLKSPPFGGLFIQLDFLAPSYFAAQVASLKLAMRVSQVISVLI